MAREELEGEWVQGWPDRKRARLMPSKDAQGRTIFARTPLLELEGLITPTEAYYIIAQLNMPEPIHPDDYEFSVEGLVERPLKLTLKDLQKLPTRTVRAVTECAGDDGEFFHYLKNGGQKPSRLKKQDEAGGWNQMSNPDGSDKPNINDILDTIPTTCLVSGGEWTGTPLSEVLKLAGVKSNAVCVHLVGFDSGTPDPTAQYLSAGRTDIEVYDPGVINYDKGLELEKALHPDTILAWAHNGEYLQHVHGAPLRLVVPGWSGNWWVKWIDKIELLDYIPDCYYQTHYFVLADTPDSPRKPCKELGCKSIITYPVDEDSPMPRGSHVIKGLAWSGRGAIKRVEVSVDDGKTWNDAYVEEHNDRWLWKRWSYVWEANEPGKYSIKARATDEEGRVQPQQPWNFQQKHFDGIVPSDIVIE